MNKLSKQIALVFVALFATMCVISSCSEEECMIDAEREQKIQKLLSVSKALANKHEIGLCFTERMIRGGIDTLTVEDLEQAYEVYAANTVEFYVCTDSVKANENGLKLSRSSRMTRESAELEPDDGGTLLADYDLIWTPQNNKAALDYSGLIKVRIDWGYYISAQGVVTYFPRQTQAGGVVIYYPIYPSFYADPNNDLVFEANGEFEIHMDGARCDFVIWAKETVFTRLIKLTLCSYSSNYTNGTFTLSNNNTILHV